MLSHSFTNIVAVSNLWDLWHIMDHFNKESVNKVMGIPILNFTSPPAPILLALSALRMPIHGKTKLKNQKTYLIQSRNEP